MTDNQFDNLFRQRLEGHASKVPDDMWQRIHDKDKDRKGFYIPRWYMLAALLLLISFAGAYYLYTNDGRALPGTTEKNITGTKEKKKNYSGSIQQKMNENKQPVYQSENAAIEKNKNNADDKDDSNKQNSNKQNSNKKIVGKTSKNKITVADNDQNDGNDLTVKRFKKSSDAIIDMKTDTASVITQTDSAYVNKKKVIIAQKDTTQNEANKEAAIEKDSSDAVKFSLELYASPDMPFDKITSSNSDYAGRLNDAIKMRLSYTVGTRITVAIGKRFVGKIGVQYSVINARSAFNSDSILVINTYKNRYKSIDVPLIFGYSTKGNGVLHASFNTGIILNITSKYKGTVPSVSGEAINIKTTNVYRKNTGASLYFGVTLSTKLTGKIDLFAEPYLKYRINSMVSGSQLFDHKIHTAGISLGLKYKLFKTEE